jgi:branched-chain amino acid transport system permease protein
MVIASTMIAKLLGRGGLGMPAVSNFVIVIVIMGLFNGSSAARPAQPDSWRKALFSGLSAGVITGTLVGLFALILGTLYANGMDARTYLSALSADAVRLFLFTRSAAGSAEITLGPVSTQSYVLSGALLHLVLFTVSGVAGAAIARLLRNRVWWKALSARINGVREQVVSQPVVSRVLANKYSRYVGMALIVLLLFLLPQQVGSYWNYILGTVGIYILLGLGLNIIVGLSGQLVLGYVAFFAVGAYSFALLTSPFPHDIGLGFWPALVIGVLLAAFTGLLLGLPILNLRGDYLAIVTLGFGEIIRILIRSDMMTPLTDGPRGVRSVAQPTLLGRSFSSDTDFMYLILIAVAVVVFVAYRLQSSQSGRAWLAIREDQTVAQASGVEPFKFKLLALTLGAAFAGLAGVIFASRNQFTGPEDHILMVSINVLCLVIVGGMGSIPGVILGAFALKGLPEVLRDFETYRMLAFGALLVIMMILRPEGLWPARRPELEKAEDPVKEELAAAAGAADVEVVRQ